MCVISMPPPGQTGRRKHYIYRLFIRPSVRPSIRCQPCEHDILKTNELILMQIGRRSTLWSGGQSSRSHEAKDRSGGLAEASRSIPLSRVAFPVLICTLCRIHNFLNTHFTYYVCVHHTVDCGSTQPPTLSGTGNG